MTSTSSPFQNAVLNSLSASDLKLIQPSLEPEVLPVRHVIEVPNKPIKHVYFLEDGLASIVATNKSHRLEVGLVGRDGMTGIAVVLGNDRSPNETFIQVAGSGNSTSVQALRAAMERSRTLERALLNCAYAFLNQTSRTALSNGTATLEERLARWLLMASDRLGGDNVPLTHEFLSLMLGVRRAGVTVALNFLEKRGIIALNRKQIHILDREGLKKGANGTYHDPEGASN
jgi:CRP-like cAMP-binding protein